MEVNIITWRRTEFFTYSSVWRGYQTEHVKIVMLIDLNQKLLFFVRVCILYVYIHKQDDDRKLHDEGTLMYLVTGIDFEQN